MVIVRDVPVVSGGSICSSFNEYCGSIFIQCVLSFQAWLAAILIHHIYWARCMREKGQFRVG